MTHLKIEVRALSAITKRQFRVYEEARLLGIYNMMTEAGDVGRVFAGLSSPTYMGIMKNYTALCAKWPDVRNLGRKLKTDRKRK